MTWRQIFRESLASMKFCIDVLATRESQPQFDPPDDSCTKFSFKVPSG